MLGACTGLVSDVTGLLHARSDGLDELGLLAVAGEVGQGGASISGQGIEEAVGLVCQFHNHVVYQGKTYRARRNIRELGAGKAGNSESNDSLREPHFDMLLKTCINKMQQSKIVQAKLNRKDSGRSCNE